MLATAAILSSHRRKPGPCRTSWPHSSAQAPASPCLPARVQLRRAPCRIPGLVSQAGQLALDAPGSSTGGSAAPAALRARAPGWDQRPPARSDRPISSSPGVDAGPGGCQGSRSGAAGGVRAASPRRRSRHGQPSLVSGGRLVGARSRSRAGARGSPRSLAASFRARSTSQPDASPEHEEADEADEHERRALSTRSGR